MVVNFLSFCLSWKVFISLSCLKHSFAGDSILSWQVYSYSTLNISSEYTLWLYTSHRYLLLLRNSLIILWELPTFMSCCFQEFLFVFWQFDYNVSACGPVLVHLSWSLLSFLNLDVHFLPQIWEVLTITSSNKLSTSFSLSLLSETAIMHLLSVLLVPLVLLTF